LTFTTASLSALSFPDLKDAARRASRSGYVLIVDDNDDAREINALILAHAGYMTSQARDGAEALASARARPPVAILMDIFMPIMDGLTATQLLNTDAALKHIPVIAQTAQPATLDGDRVCSPRHAAQAMKSGKVADSNE
jgi:two-component system, cell cycle response regulator DivK